MAKRKRVKLTHKEQEFKELDDKYFDLPDGAYFAIMEEHGYYPEDIIDISESIAEKEAKVNGR